MTPVRDTVAAVTAALGDRYAIDRELGRGGMATVYVAQDRRHGREVAIKVLRPDVAAAIGAERFLREIAIAARLTHPHVLPLIDSGQAAGSLYYVMPYVRGESLRQRLAREGRLPLKDALRIARELGAGLDYAHREGFIHRDVKPENVLLADGLAVIVDFGIARAIAQAAGEHLTEVGLAIGTPDYMSPEQAAGDRELDGRCDLYGLACVVYEMLAGEPPFRGGTARATIARHLSEPPPPLRARRPDAPAAVEQALARALAKDPADRFSTVAQFVAALEETGSGDAVRALVGQTRAIAVLPFVNSSADADNEYLSDGITDELISALTQVEGLRVTSRTSAFALKGKPQDVRAIGALLGVSAVLEGTVRKAGERLRITVQLTAADDGRNLWSERYDRTLDDVFAIQDEIARTIVNTLRRTLLASIADPTPRRYTHNLEAYALYLKGRYAWNKRSQEGVLEAIAYFEQAIERDPRYALAYSGLSDAYGLQVDYRGLPVTEGYERARMYALKALELDDSLAEAHTSLAWVQHAYDWDWDGAARSYRRAIELNPAYATAHHWYSFTLLATGQAEQALVEAHAALELDPSSLSIRRGLGWLYYYTRRYETALYHLRRAIAINPASEDSYRILGLVLTQQGAYDEAARAFQEAITLSPDLSYATAGLAHVLALRGRRREAEVLLAELEARARDRYVSPVAFCIVHLGLRNTDQVFQWFERAYQDRRGWLSYLKVDPMCDVVKDDPRFGEFVKRMKL